MTEGQPEEYSEANLHELVGGIKNSLDRGEEVNKAKQSFINAGYAREEIEDAVAVLGLGDAPKVLPNTSVIPTKEAEKKPDNEVKKLPVQSPQKNPLMSKIVFPSKKEVKKLPVAKFNEPQKLNKALVIILILLGILFVVIAGFLGVFWDQLFGPF